MSQLSVTSVVVVEPRTTVRPLHRYRLELVAMYTAVQVAVERQIAKQRVRNDAIVSLAEFEVI